MKFRRWYSLSLLAASMYCSGVANAQVEEVLEKLTEVVQRTVKPALAAGEAAPDAKEETKPGEAEPETPRSKPKADLPPRFMVLRLQDGSTLTGDLAVNEIKVKTEFGELTIPIARIRSFTPGLGSNSKTGEDLKAKLKLLESDDYKTREQAHKDLAAMGPQIAKQIEPFTTSENAEVKRHVTEILKEFEQLMEEQSDDDEGSGKAIKPLIELDTIETAEFTVLGKISPETFGVASKYGPLTVALGDIRSAERPVETKDSMRRSVSINGQNLATRGFKNTNIRVQAGDRITITSSGTLTLTPWGSNAMSTPDGMPNYGWYLPGQVPAGALCAKIGDKGSVFKVGTKHSMVAKSSGTLQLAIGMMAEYANEGYNFPGEFKVKVKVDPQ